MASLTALEGQRDKDEAGLTFPVIDRDGYTPMFARDGTTPATFTVYGSESRTFKKRRAEMYREIAKSGEELDVDTIRVYEASCAMKSWTGWDAGDEPLPCTIPNVRALLTFDFLRVQVESHARKGADFFAAASSASAAG
jgi:hypothetical protein